MYVHNTYIYNIYAILCTLYNIHKEYLFCTHILCTQSITH